LRERREDIEPLARHLLGRVGGRVGRSMLLGPDALRAMLRYDWPGNARELENALEYAVAVCRGQTIHRNDLPQEVQEGSALPASPVGQSSREMRPAAEIGTGESSTDIERERIRVALDAHRWSRAATAKALGMSRTTLWRRMRELGLVG
jgi:DNA-binding NtrC family response regulator